MTDHDLITCWGLVVEGYTRTHRMLLDDVEQRGLAAAWFELMLRLYRTPGHRLPMSRLAAELSMTTGGLTKLVDKLEKAGLTERQSDASDRRRIFTTLTESGEAVAAEAIGVHGVLLRKTLLGSLSDREVRTLGAIMRTLRDALPPDGSTAADGDAARRTADPV